jgi:hypothetical protein
MLGLFTHGEVERFTTQKRHDPAQVTGCLDKDDV